MSYNDVEELLEAVRVETENLDTSEYIGITDKEIVRFLNIAQRQLQSKIVKKSPNEFGKFYFPQEITEEGAVQVYNMPIDSFMRSKVSSLWLDGCLQKMVYSHNINSYDTSTSCGDCHMNYCQCGGNATECGYTVIGNKIHLTRDTKSYRGCKVPDSVRILYCQALPNIEQAAIKFTASSGVNITSGILNVDATFCYDANAISNKYKWTLVDCDGNQVARNVRISDFDTQALTVTLSDSNTTEYLDTSSYGTLASGELPNIDLYLVRGFNSSTHCQLEPLAMDYITRYAIIKLLQRDGSSEYQVHSRDLVAMLAEIEEAYSYVTDDIMSIAQFPED